MYEALNKNILIISCVLVFTIKTNTQEVRVINNKRTITTVNSNKPDTPYIKKSHL